MEYKERYEKYKENYIKARIKNDDKYFEETGIKPTTRRLNYKKKRVEELRSKGCTNPWMVMNYGHEPKFKEGDHKW